MSKLLALSSVAQESDYAWDISSLADVGIAGSRFIWHIFSIRRGQEDSGWDHDVAYYPRRTRSSQAIPQGWRTSESVISIIRITCIMGTASADSCCQASINWLSSFSLTEPDGYSSQPHPLTSNLRFTWLALPHLLPCLDQLVAFLSLTTVISPSSFARFDHRMAPSMTTMGSYVTIAFHRANLTQLFVICRVAVGGWNFQWGECPLFENKAIKSPIHLVREGYGDTREARFRKRVLNGIKGILQITFPPALDKVTV